MYVQKIATAFTGYVKFRAEGYYIEKFINTCRFKSLYLGNLRRESNTTIVANIQTKYFKEICKIAKKHKCKIKICQKNGLPFFINRYRKRKTFVISLVLLVMLLITLSRFVWNIEIIGNNEISSEEILELVKSEGLDIGKLKSKIDAKKIVNEIRLARSDISWVRSKNNRHKCRN